MAPKKRPRRQRKSDRILSPGASKVEIECDYGIAPLDRLALQMDQKWGIDRLPELVSVDMAAKYGRAMAHLNECLQEADPAKCAAAAQNCIKGLNAMDAEATAAGQPQATGDFWEYELEAQTEGGQPFRFAIIKDQYEWPAIKAKRPDLEFYTLREVANALSAYRGDMLAETKKHFPTAEVTAIKTKTPVDYKNGGDQFEF